MVSLLQYAPDQKNIIDCVNAARDLDGDMAEFGVFEGGSAEIICKHKGDRALYLFDTFTGLPAPSAIDTGYHAGDYAVQQQDVAELLAPYPSVNYVRGKFPITTKEWKHLRFSFVHFDADLYESCKDALEYFYPRLIPGGVMLLHDFHGGVLKAVEESGLKYEKLDNQGLIKKMQA